MAVEGFVVEAFDVGPRVRRLVFDVPCLDQLRLPGAPDEAVGIQLPTDGAGASEGRNYTIRRYGPGNHRLSCDVLLHHRGLVSDWARRAPLGARVSLDHARSWYRPEPATRWQLLAADLSGLPALARILEELPAGTAATAIVEVLDKSDLDYLPTRSDVAVVTSIATGNGHAPSRLGDLISQRVLPEGRGYCWFAGEARTTRQVRKYLRDECSWESDQLDVVGYWRVDADDWNRDFEVVGEQMLAVYERALADGKGDKLAAEELDIALERAGL